MISYFVEMLVYGDYSLKVIGLDGIEEIIGGICSELADNSGVKAKIINGLESWTKLDNSLDEKLKSHLINALQ